MLDIVRWVRGPLLFAAFCALAGTPLAAEPAGTADAPTEILAAATASAPGTRRRRWAPELHQSARRRWRTAHPILLSGLQYGGDYRNYRHSPVASLTLESVRRLHVAWSAPTGTTGQFEASPIVNGGVMYVSSSYNRLLALDAKTGQFLWRYDVALPSDLRLCCGPPNRGVAIGGDLLVMATLDAHLIAFDRKSGKVAWNSVIADYKDGYSATSAPLIVGDLVFTGLAGGEFGAPGFVDAYQLSTGKRVWRRNTVPQQASDPATKSWAGESWKSGGSPAWTTGAYDAETDTLFWTVGNPSPDWNGDSRAGDNSSIRTSVLALDPKTGAMKWYFQFNPPRRVGLCTATPSCSWSTR